MTPSTNTCPIPFTTYIFKLHQSAALRQKIYSVCRQKCRTEISVSKRAIDKKLTKASALIGWDAPAVRHQDVMEAILLTCRTKNDRACVIISINTLCRYVHVITPHKNVMLLLKIALYKLGLFY